MKTTLSAFAALVLALAAPLAQARLDIQHWVAETGARVYFVENHDLPLLDVSVDFPAGTARETPDKSGIAGLTNALLDLGADGLPEDEIARRLADVGAQLSARLEPDRAGVILRTLSSAREREQALDMLTRVLAKPDFPDAVVEREKGRMVSTLKEADTKPDTIANKAFMKALYGDHPYALPAGGEVATVEKLVRADLVDFHRRHYAADGAVIAIMGDLTRAEAEALALRLTRGLPAKGDYPALPQVPTPGEARSEFLPHPASQSHVLMGYPGTFRGDPDYYALYVGNYILGGGGFVSRLTAEVREKRGLAYSVYSYFVPLERPGPFQLGLQTKKDQAGEALAVVRETLKRFIDKGPTEKELKAAKQNLVGGFALRIDSNKKILDYLAVIGFYELPLDYLDRFTGHVEAVSAAQIRDAFRRRLDLDHLVTVVVGAPEGMTAGR